MEDTGLNNNIDAILKRFDKSLTVWEPDIREFHKTDTDDLIDKMISFGLIKFKLPYEDLKRHFVLEPFGHEVKRHGSWTEYLADKDDERKANRKLVESSIFTNTLQKWLLIATTFFSVIAVGVTTADHQIHEQELEVAKEELRLHKLELEKQQSDSLTCPCQACKANRQSNPKTDSSHVKTK